MPQLLLFLLKVPQLELYLRQGASKYIEFVLVELEVGRVTNDILPHTKGGEECDFVLSGTIKIEVGNLSYTLNEGDSIRFNPEIPHKIENRSDKKVSYISAITPPSF